MCALVKGAWPVLAASLSLVMFSAEGRADSAHLPPSRLSPRDTSDLYPVVAADGAGDAYALWMQTSSSNFLAAGSSWSVVAHRWRADAALSPQGAEFPQVAANQRGSAVAVWQQLVAAAGWVVEGSYRQSLATPWQRARIVERASGQAETPVVGIDGRGNAVAVWELLAGHSSRIVVATRSVRRSTWSPPHTLMASAQEVSNPALAVSPDGTAVAVWKQHLRGGVLTGSHNVIWASRRRAGARTWSAPLRLGIEAEPPGQSSGTTQVPGPHVAVNSAGQGIVVWQGRDGNTIVPEAAILRRGSWSRAIIAHREALLPQVGIDRRGLATVVWTGPEGVQAATGPTARRGAFRVETVARGSDTAFAQVAMTRHGDAFVAWNNRRTLFASSRRASAPNWCPPINLGLGGVAQVAAAKNTGILVWQVPVQHPSSTYIAAGRIAECRRRRT